MINDIVAERLGEISVLLDLEEKDWESRAFRDAKASVKRLDKPVSKIYEEDGQERLKSLDDIGSGIASVIADYVEHGSMTKLKNLKSRYPDDIFQITSIRGVGPSTTRKLLDNLDVDTVDDVKQAAENGEIRDISGLGPTTEESIIEGIETLQSKEDAVLISTADRITSMIRPLLSSHSAVRKVSVAGEQRRRCETVSHIIFVVATNSPADVYQSVEDHSYITGVRASSESSVTYDFAKDDVSIEVEAVEPHRFGSALFRRTGSTGHVEAVEQRGRNEDVADETRVYEAASLPFIPAELREGRDEVKQAAKDELPVLVETEDVRGDLHVHTDWSDGRGSVRDMVEAAMRQGYDYIALTDHSVSSGFAGGLSADELARKNEVVETVNDETGLTVLKGAEVDILGHGSLDYDENVLGQLDIVVASVHSQFNMDEATMTQRLRRAAKHPQVDILGHLTGRLLLERPGYDVDVDAVLRAAAEHGTAVEINSTPRRLDIAADTARRASELGVSIVINTDSHAAGSLPSMRYGVDQARRAGLESDDVVNTKPVEDWPENMSF